MPSRCEYYLGIEGFLLHLRNILAFFTNRKDKASDLIINEPQVWAGKEIDQRQYSDLVKRAREINEAYGERESTCYDQISKFLNHCTTLRHERVKGWEIDAMYVEIEQVVSEFENRFAGLAMVVTSESPPEHTDRKS